MKTAYFERSERFFYIYPLFLVDCFFQCLPLFYHFAGLCRTEPCGDGIRFFVPVAWACATGCSFGIRGGGMQMNFVKMIRKKQSGRKCSQHMAVSAGNGVHAVYERKEES